MELRKEYPFRWSPGNFLCSRNTTGLVVNNTVSG
jgi:hypothetical protein